MLKTLSFPEPALQISSAHVHIETNTVVPARYQHCETKEKHKQISEVSVFAQSAWAVHVLIYKVQTVLLDKGHRGLKKACNQVSYQSRRHLKTDTAGPLL